jgi:hypothetical protein
MSARPLLDTTCLLVFAIGIGVIFLAYGPVGFFSLGCPSRSRAV